MSQAFNLSQFANKVNTSGQADLTTAVTGTLPIANGGTNNNALGVTDGGIVYADGTRLQTTAAGTAGQLLTSQGTGTPTWENPPQGGFSNAMVFETSGTFDASSLGVTKAKITIYAGGGGAGGGSSTVAGKAGGQGGYAVAIVSGLSGTYTVTVGNGGSGGNFGSNSGATGGTSSFGSLVSATGGAGGGAYNTGTQGSIGVGTVSSGYLIRTSASGLFASVGYPAIGIFIGNGNTSTQAGVAFSKTANLGSSIGGGGVTNSAGRGGVGGVVLVEY